MVDPNVGTISSANLRSNKIKDNIVVQDPLLLNQPIKLVIIEPDKTLETASGLHRCPLCPKIFVVKNELHRHSYVHVQEKKFQCEICLRKFKGPHILKTHLRTHQVDNITHECSICLKKFPNDYLYKRHVGRNSQKIEPCPHCPLKYHFKKDLDFHIFKTHTNITYFCCVCKQTQTDTPTLLEHLQTHQLEKTEFQCEYCGRCLITKRALIQHYSLVHKNLPGVICEVCGYRALFPHALKDHMLRHTAEKPELCTVCGKGFAKRNLKTHMLVHTGEKPLKCKYCEKRFNQHGPLKIHMRSHTGERPYKCDICPDTFISSNALKHHKRSKHNVIENTKPILS